MQQGQLDFLGAQFNGKEDAGDLAGVDAGAIEI
jgi:hypothetical protein